MDKTLRAAQLKMLVILDEIDRICRLNNIDYWLDAGTLLGAKRHGGFIPWDDDIDICMKREDYNKFISVCNIHLDKNNFFLQTAYSDKYYVDYNTPCKVRMNKTKIIEKNEMQYNYYDMRSHHGLFVDIFPYDKYSSNVYIRKYIERFMAQLFKIKVISSYSKLPFLKNIMTKILSRVISKKLLLSTGYYLSKKMSKRKSNYCL
ncbi:LicD family protein, partial [Salmonella enterica subsp. enterica]